MNSRRADAAPIVEEGFSYAELMPLVGTILATGTSVLLRGHPGVGKSSMAVELARQMNLPLVDIRLAQRDPADIGGVYFPDREKGRLELFPPAWVKRACEEPTFIFLDEINAAVTRLHQSVAYQIVLEHRIGDFHFHPQTVVLAAGNLEEDNAIVTSLSSALCNRFAHFILRVDVESWLDWGTRAGIHPQILAYIGFSGRDALYCNDGGLAFPPPRSWEMASRVLAAVPPEDAKRAVAACVGPTQAEKFFSFMRVYQRIPVQAILKNGKKMDFSKGEHADPSFIYAAVFSVASFLSSKRIQLNEDVVKNAVAFLRSPGMDPEYVMLFLKQIYQKLPEGFGEFRKNAGFRRLAGELVDLRRTAYDSGNPVLDSMEDSPS